MGMKDFDHINFADSQVNKLLRTDEGDLIIQYSDWQENKKRITFRDVIGYEVFGLEGEELSHGQVYTENDLIKKACSIAEEDINEYKCYSLVSAWSDAAVFSVVAKAFLEE